jgi:uncharacterized protein (TIGR00255 family)
MLHSMTGYGRIQKSFDNYTVTVEIKSINSKTFDLRVRLPMLYQSKEIELRRLLGNELIRGKVDFSMHLSGSANSDFKIDSSTFEAYFNQLNEISGKMGLDKGDLLYTITRLPGVVVQNDGDVSEDEWAQLELLIMEALKKTNAFREQEGLVLMNDMKMRIDTILTLLLQVEPFEKERMEKVRQRISGNFEQFIPAGKMDENRFEQEILYYLDKLDITEEKTRLLQHCNFFQQVCADKKDSLDKGKKLNFIIQEIGREVNTLGSKANFADIQRIVVMMKGEADKVKEQLANIL